MIFSRGKIRNRPKFKFGGDDIECVDSYTYLGILFNYNESFQKSIAKQVSQARKAKFSMLSKAKNVRLPTDIQCDLFEKLVLPVLLYGSEIWGCGDLKQADVFHRKFLKEILHLKSYTANCMVYGETGTFEIKDLVKMKMVSFWCRIITGSKNKLSFIMYKLLRSMHYDTENTFTSKWIDSLENVFFTNTGLGHIWMKEIVSK